MQKMVQTIFIVAIFVFAFVAFVPFAVFAALGYVVINEIAWMGTEANPADEWIEILNVGSNSVDLSGWGIYEAGGATLVEELSGIIGSGEYFLIERSDDATVDIAASQPPTAWSGSGFSNSGEHLALKDDTGAIIDAVNALSGWFAGDNAARATMERIDPRKDGTLASNWATNNGIKINGKDAVGNTINGTPKQENSVYNNPPSSPSSEPPSSSSQPPSSSSPSHPIYPTLTVDAGFDKTVLVGSSVSFSGLALGINNAPLFDGRFLWNFGDGVVQEGKAFEHIYYFPGVYTAALTVSAGPYSGFNSATIIAIVPALTIKNTQAGEDGFIVVANGSDAKLDLGGMILRDNTGSQFLIPKNTFVAAHGEVTFPNRVSGVLKSSGAVLLYDAAGREVRAAQSTPDNLQPISQSTTASELAEAVIKVSSPAGLPGGTPKGGETANVQNGIAEHDDAFAPQKEIAAVLHAPQNAESGISKTSLFFWGSVLVGIFSAAGFFLFKNLF